MKKIKKLFLSIILLALCMCSIIPFAGCKKDKWVEVQSITYTTDSGSVTLTSKCVWDITSELIEKDEFDSAPENQQITVYDRREIKLYYPNVQEISNDKKEFLSVANDKTGKAYYFNVYDSNYYEKYFYNGYSLEYVKLKFTDDNAIEINYNDKTTKVMPLSYQISYFSN